MPRLTGIRPRSYYETDIVGWTKPICGWQYPYVRMPLSDPEVWMAVDTPPGLSVRMFLKIWITLHVGWRQFTFDSEAELTRWVETTTRVIRRLRDGS